MEPTVGFLIVVDELRYCDASSLTSAIILRWVIVDSADYSPKCLCTTPLPLLRIPAHHLRNVCTGGSNYRLQFYLHIYSCTRRLCTKGRAAHLGQPVEELGGSSCLEEGLPQGCTPPPADLLPDMID